MVKVGGLHGIVIKGFFFAQFCQVGGLVMIIQSRHLPNLATRSNKKVEMFLEKPPPRTHCLNSYAKDF
jgi:hypothetical protein